MRRSDAWYILVMMMMINITVCFLVFSALQRRCWGTQSAAVLLAYRYILALLLKTIVACFCMYCKIYMLYYTDVKQFRTQYC